MGPRGGGRCGGVSGGRCGVRGVEALGKTADTQKSRGLLEEPGAGCQEEGPAAGATPASQPGSHDVKRRLPVGLGVRGPRCAAQCPIAMSPVWGVGVGCWGFLSASAAQRGERSPLSRECASACVSAEGRHPWGSLLCTAGPPAAAQGTRRFRQPVGAQARHSTERICISLGQGARASALPHKGSRSVHTDPPIAGR